jgi:hypothetical protein
MPANNNWIDSIFPFPRPEYAKQTEALLTDLLWRSPGSDFSSSPLGRGVFSNLVQLKNAPGFNSASDPERLVPTRRKVGSQRLFETWPLGTSANLSAVVSTSGGVSPIEALFKSVLAPRSRGDRSEACVPLHPSIIALQTLFTGL